MMLRITPVSHSLTKYPDGYSNRKRDLQPGSMTVEYDLG